ncbi:MAG: outer membrane protein transport protein [Bacteroidetes bacterium]|nr:outer membrane protein transport protein [Bacteroidota bacterium]
MRKFIYIMLLFAIATWSAHAGGYQVRLQGQKQTGIGLIGTPFNFGASSMFYNPGALSMMKNKYDFSLGASFIMGKAVFQKDATDYQAKTDNPIGTPFYFYGAGKITDKLAVGLGVYTPFGTSTKWDDDWAGQMLIQNISLQAIYYQLTASYQINEKIGIGAGFVYATGKVKLNKALPYNNSEVNLEGNTSNIGFNVGIYFKPNDKFSFGIDYRSKIIMKMEDGDATFTVPSALSSNLPKDNKFDAELPMPANLDFGLAFNVNEKLTLAAEVNWVMWSTYDSLIFTFKESGDLLNTANPREYKDSWIIRIGGQYKLNDKLTFRAGGYYDPTPTNEKYFNPETISLNTTGLTLGLSYQPIENLSIDLSYLHLFGQEAEKAYEPDNFSGKYKTQVSIPGIGISYSF